MNDIIAGMLRTVLAVLSNPSHLREVRPFFRFVVLTVSVLVLFTAAFHLLMAYEGRDHTWISAVYWVVTAMTTVGFGDITFSSDTGRLFSIVVMLVGVVVFQVLLTFIAVQHVFLPALKAGGRARVPERLDQDLAHHVLVCGGEPLIEAVITGLNRHGIRWAAVEDQVAAAVARHDLDQRVVLGALDDPQTWLRAGVGRAALVLVAGQEQVNANTVMTVREAAPLVHVVTTARRDSAEEVLALAGANRVLRQGGILGRALSRRIPGPDGTAHYLTTVGGVQLAEAPVAGTALEGETLAGQAVRSRLGLSVVAVLERGVVMPPDPQRTLHRADVLILAGDAAGLEAFNRAYPARIVHQHPVLILGGGRVGRACAADLDRRGIDHRLVELVPGRGYDPARTIHGDASESEVLERAGLAQAGAVIITPGDDDLVIYLAILCHRLRPDTLLACRFSHLRNVETLLRAGADVLLNGPATAAAEVFGGMLGDDEFVLGEGMRLVRRPADPIWIGRPLAQCRGLRENGWLTVAIRHPGGMQIAPGPADIVPAGAELLLAGGRRVTGRERPAG